ncbi:hypothetical protein ACGF3C_21935 [Micromonospora sp. NPDC047762]|uniref:hypothetical protein n=1 Tax=unclassified Micromonospora TaxID=2617518 RepID=UPI0033C9E9E3
MESDAVFGDGAGMNSLLRAYVETIRSICRDSAFPSTFAPSARCSRRATINHTRHGESTKGGDVSQLGALAGDITSGYTVSLGVGGRRDQRPAAAAK